MWYEERAKKSANTTKTINFSLCCMKGLIQLPYQRRPPDLLLNLMNGQEPRSKHFRENIQAYNSMLCFTSMGGKVRSNSRGGGGPPQFILSGQNFHQIGSLILDEGSTPKFVQLYIYDTLNEISKRCSHFRYKSYWVYCIKCLVYYILIFLIYMLCMIFFSLLCRSNEQNNSLDRTLVEDITNMMDENNVLVKSFRRVRDHVQ